MEKFSGNVVTYTLAKNFQNALNCNNDIESTCDSI